VARFNSVSLIASGFVKLFFKRVMAACRSAWPNELINSWVLGVPDGEGDGVADLAGVGGPLGAGKIEGAEDWANPFAVIKIEIAAGLINRTIVSTLIRQPR
jgi:hypothetical protein